MTVPNLAECLRVSKGTIYNKASKHELEFDLFKLGGTLVAETAEVADYIENAKLIRR